jgi:hypothetical protein
LLACATPYQPIGFRGGYSDFEVEPGIHYVVFEGNAHTGHAVVMQYWHRRAGEICDGSGSYEILSQSDISREQLVLINGDVTNVRKSGFAGYIRCK